MMLCPDAQSCLTLLSPMNCSPPILLSMGFSRQETCRVPFPPQECSNYCTIALISHASKVMLKILKPGFSNTWTMSFQMFKLVLEKAEEPEIKLPTSAGSSKKAREFQKNIYFCFIDYAKAFDCVDHHKLWKILQEMGIPDHISCLLRNLYAGRSNS